MAKRYEQRKAAVKQDIEQKSDNGVRIFAILGLIGCGVSNIFAASLHVDAPFAWYIFPCLLAIAAGKEIAKPLFERIFGGKK